MCAAALNSCTKADFKANLDSEHEFLSDYKFLKSSLQEIARLFSPIISNKQLREIVYNKTKLKFDGEYTVLIKDLAADPDVSVFVNRDAVNKIHESLFSKAKTKIYPQIYIPKFQFQEDAGIEIRSELEHENEEPLIVFYTGNADVDSSTLEDVLPGYKLIGGELIYERMVDEEYANLNEVWVFYLNETVDENGKLPVPCDVDPCRTGCPLAGSVECGGSGGGGSIDGPDDDPTDGPLARNDFPDLNHNKITFGIQFMNVRNPKESWVAGASEVSVRAKLVCHNGRHLGIPGDYQEEYSSDQFSNYLGKLVRKIRRNELNEVLTLNFILQTQWQNEVPSQDPVHFIYVLFERDIWPAKLNTDHRYALNSPITFESAPGPFPLFYRAHQHIRYAGDYPYTRSHFTNTLILATAQTYAGTGSVSNPDIAFNTILY